MIPRVRPIFTLALVVILIAGGLALHAFAQGQALPKSVTIGTNPAGTVYFALASGIAKVVSGGAGYLMVVQPHAGTSTMLPLINTGEMEFGIQNGVDLWLAYRGPAQQIGGRNPFAHTPNVRLVMRGAPLMVGLLVRKDSPIKTVHDVKGKRFTGEYRAHLAVWYNMFGHLSSAGLTWNDVKVVPVNTVNDGVDALLQNRADVTQHALNSAKVKEADAAVGVRHISDDCSPAGEARMKKAVPGYYPRIVKPGAITGVVEDTCVVAYDTYFFAGKTVPDQVVELALKAVWEGGAELVPIHPMFKEWTQDRAVDPEASIPYHPGAIRFYKERGAWKPGMDQVQQKLLAVNP
ncbi:MAG TPA: TAXI family TRAP transporter solute-binding subunit [Methylomirabilota bacterium]|nr:TAXI family TRAP transporter solute-binding subunit [Methylomirabilota bacterium]